MSDNDRSEAEKRSNVESLGLESGNPPRSGTPQHSGTKEMGSNIALFVLCFGILLGCFYALGTYPEGGWIWWSIAIALYALAFMIPLWVLPSKTNEAVYSGGTDLYMK